MTKSEEAIEQEHKDFLREIANKVYELVRNPKNMARFRNQVKLFCEKNEEHEVEVRQLWEACKADPEIQAANKELEREKWRKTWDEMTEDERTSVDPYEYTEGPPKGYGDFVWHYNIGFWGPPTKTTNLWYYLSTPTEREYMDGHGKGKWDSWWLEALKSSNDEKIISCYALLAAIHDHEIPEKPLYTKMVYDGGWSLRDKWARQLSLKCRRPGYPMQDSFEGGEDIRAWVARAFDDVKADLARIERNKSTDSHTLRTRRESRKEDENGAMLFESEWTEEDRKLIHQIEFDIKKHLDRYRDAGEWLDEQFYDEASYWQKVEKRAGSMEDMLEDPEIGVLSDEQMRELQRLRELLGAKDKPYKIDRITEAMKYLADEYKISRFFELRAAQAVCLITWVLTDPDVQAAQLGLTRFEEWRWNELEPSYRQNRMFDLPNDEQGVLALGTSRGEQPWLIEKIGKKPGWMRIVRAAWVKFEAEKDLEAEKPAGTEQGTKAGKKQKVTPKKLEVWLKNILEQAKSLQRENGKGQPTEEDNFFAVFDLLVNQIKIDPNLKKDLPPTPPDVAQRLSAGALFLYAQVYYKIIEVVSSSPVSYADLSLNQDYLQVVKKIKYLLSLDEFKGFTGEFNPPEHILPSCGLGDLGWEDGAARYVEGFLASVQIFLNELDFSGDEPVEVTFVQKWLHKQIEPIIEKTEEYRQKTEKYFNGLIRNVKREKEETEKTAKRKEQNEPCTKEEYNQLALIHRRLKDLMKLLRSSDKDVDKIAYKQIELDEDVTEFWPTIENIGRSVGINVSGKLDVIKEIISDKEIQTSLSDVGDLFSTGCYIDGKYVDEIELAGMMREEEEQAAKPRNDLIQDLDRIMVRLAKCFGVNKEIKLQQPSPEKPTETGQKIKPVKEPSKEATIFGPEDEGITVTQASRLLGVDKGRVSRLADEGKIRDNKQKGKTRRLSKISVLLLKDKREHEDLLKDAAEDLQDRASKIPDRH